MKQYRVQDKIGKARHVVSFHDGQKTHQDGSAFFDISIFSNARKRDKFINELKRDGYAEA